MSVKYYTELDATTDATQSSNFLVENKATVFIDGLATTETATLQFSTNGAGSNWVDAVNYDTGETVQATATKNSLLIDGPGLYRINKDATASAVAVIVVR